MAQRTITVCDLDAEATPATTQAVIELGDDRRVVDLCEEHITQLRRVIDEVIPLSLSAARKNGSGATRERRKRSRTPATGSARQRKQGARARRAPTDLEHVRAWARQEDIPVKDRGRLSNELMRRYEAAHQANPPA